MCFIIYWTSTSSIKAGARIIYWITHFLSCGKGWIIQSKVFLGFTVFRLQWIVFALNLNSCISNMWLDCISNHILLIQVCWKFIFFTNVLRSRNFMKQSGKHYFAPSEQCSICNELYKIWMSLRLFTVPLLMEDSLYF